MSFVWDGMGFNNAAQDFQGEDDKIESVCFIIVCITRSVIFFNYP